jgi:lipoate-protein ligase A
MTPTVSFGKNEPSRGLYALDEAERQGVAFVRRPTGGRAVLHHLELTYAMVFPVRSFSGLKKAYRLINQGLGRGLKLLGATVQLASPSGRGLPPDAGPCFREPTEGEVTALGRKLVGSAQVRIGPAVLQHGSIILDGDQGLLGRLRRDGQRVPPPATLRSVLGDMPEGQLLRSSIQKGFEEVLGGVWEEGEYRSDEKMAAGGLERHYGDAGWTWRL